MDSASPRVAFTLSSLDRLVVPAYTTIGFGFALASSLSLEAYASWVTRARAALVAVVDESFPIVNHELRHDERDGFFAAEPKLGPLFRADSDLDAPVPWSGVDAATGAWWAPSALAGDLEDEAHDRAVGERGFFAHACLLAGGAGLSLVIRLHHVLGDADAISALLSAWSARIDDPNAAPPSVCHDRTLLVGRAGHEHRAMPPAYHGPLPVSKSTAQSMRMLAAILPPQRFWRHRYTRAELAALKREATTPTFAPTAFEIIGAQALGRLADALGPGAQVVLQFPINVRGRLATRTRDGAADGPPLPANYWGNAFVNTVTERHDTEWLAAASLAERAALVAAAKATALAPDYAASVLDAEVARTVRPRVCYEAPKPKTILTAWVSMPLYSLAFGLGVCAVSAGPYNRVPLPVGYLLPTPPDADGALDVIVHLGEAPRAEPPRKTVV